MAAVWKAVSSAVATVAKWVSKSKLGKAVVKFAANAAFAYVVKALTPKPLFESVDQGQVLALKFDAGQPRQFIFGRAAVGGSMVDAETSGTDNAYLYRIIALADHEIDAVEQILVSGKALTFTGDWNTGYAPCTSRFTDASNNPHLWVRVLRGTADQAADSEWTTLIGDGNARLRGMACLIVKMKYNAEIYQGGEPELIAVVRGYKPYDPRTATSAWSDNPSLIARAYLSGIYQSGQLIHGVGANAEDLPDADWIAGANVCDELVALAAGGTQKRYRASGVVTGGTPHRDVLGQLAAACAGTWVDRGGILTLLPGVAQTPVLAVDESDFIATEPVTWVPAVGADQIINAVTATFVDPTQGWQPASVGRRTNAAYVTADGGYLFERPVGFGYVTDGTQAQRLAKYTLEDARRDGRLSIALPLWALEAEAGDWITITSARRNWSNKVFQIETIDLAVSTEEEEPQAFCALSLREIDDAVFAWSTSDETAYGTTILTRTIPDITVSGLTVTPLSLTSGGGSLPALTFAWTAPTNPHIRTVELEYREVGTTAILYAGSLRRDQSSVTISIGLLPGTSYEARVRGVTQDGVGAWSSWVSATTTGSFRVTGVVDGATIGTGGVRVAAQPIVQYVSDGTAVTYGAMTAPPSVVFDTAGLDPLASGERYQLTAENLTTTGFTARLKKVASATYTTRTQTGATSGGGSDPTLVMQKTFDDAHNGIYTFNATVEVYGYTAGPPGATYKQGWSEVMFWVNTGTGWSEVGKGRVNATANGINNRTVSFIASGMPGIGTHAGYEFGASFWNNDTEVSVDLVSFDSVVWQTASGTSATATSAGQTIRAVITPP